MPFPPAIHLQNADSHEVNVRPSSDQVAGVGFYVPSNGRYVISQRDIAAGELAAARDNGKYRCQKQNPADVFAAGDLLSFGTTGYVAGSDPLEVCEPSASGEQFVIAELNRSSSSSSTPTPTDPPTTISFPSHGFDLTTIEGQRFPRALHFDGANWGLPTSIDQVTHFAVTAPDANSLGVRTLSALDGREYQAVSNIGVTQGHYVYLDPETLLHTGSEVSTLRLGQVSQSSATKFNFSIDQVSGGGIGTDTRSSLQVTEFDMVASIANGDALNLNANTAGKLTLREGFTSHAWATGAAQFQAEYGTLYWLEWAGQRILQSDLLPGGSSGQVIYNGTGLSIVGQEVRVVSQVTQTI